MECRKTELWVEEWPPGGGSCAHHRSDRAAAFIFLFYFKLGSETDLPVRYNARSSSRETRIYLGSQSGNVQLGQQRPS